jgi:hypothetical protein
VTATVLVIAQRSVLGAEQIAEVPEQLLTAGLAFADAAPAVSEIAPAAAPQTPDSVRLFNINEAWVLRSPGQGDHLLSERTRPTKATTTAVVTPMVFPML